MSDRPARTPGSLEARDTFDAVVVPHLDAGHRLARWLMRDPCDADDVVQEASLRALVYFRTFAGGDGRAWFLRIVRNTCYSRRRPRCQPPIDPFEEEHHSNARPQADPETLLLRADEASSIEQALSRLPGHLHQLLVLREREGLSYRELSDVIGIPMGTVMSRLSRARKAFRTSVAAERPGAGTSSRTRRGEREAGVSAILWDAGSGTVDDAADLTDLAGPRRCVGICPDSTKALER